MCCGVFLGQWNVANTAMQDFFIERLVKPVATSAAIDGVFYDCFNFAYQLYGNFDITFGPAFLKHFSAPIMLCLGRPPRGELNLQPQISWKQSRILLSHSDKSRILS